MREFQLAAARWAAQPIGIERLPDFARLPPCIEDGATFEENAIRKARHYGPYAPGLLFADDSGLEVEALDGAPGIHDPATVTYCDGKYYTFGTGGNGIMSDDGWTWRGGA